MPGHVFISYAREDEHYAVRLAKELRRRVFEVWFDRDIRHGERWPEILEQAVRDCAAFVVLMTPEAEMSAWVRKEVNLALDSKKAIFPLLLSGQPFESISPIQYAGIKGKRLPGESFFGDLTMVPGVKFGVDRFLHKNRSEYEKAMRNSPLAEVFRRHEIESGMIEDPQEMEKWQKWGEGNRKRRKDTAVSPKRGKK
jgi:hypothetical protein